MTPPLPNPPGQDSLSYRTGTFESFSHTMLDRLVLSLQRGQLETETSAARQPGDRPVRITFAGPDHWLGALVKAWATAADVLTFYQERILQEGYMRTAVEERSVHELAQSIGYRRRPGVAGSADLAIRISDVQGLPQELDLPRRLVVRSVPPPGSEQQAFETAEPLRARAAWSLLRPGAHPHEIPPLLHGRDTYLDLRGTATGLTTGGAVLIRGTLTPATGGEGRPVASFRILTGVRIEAGEPGDPAYTRVSWDEPLVPEAADGTFDDFQVYALRQQTGIFGHNAPRWNDLPAEVRQQAQRFGGGVLVAVDGGWETRNLGIPMNATIQSLAIDGGGTLYAGTMAEGIFRSQDGGLSWRPARRGLMQGDVQAFALGPEGTLFAATPSGGVFRSTDGGDIWEAASGNSLVFLPTKRRLFRRSAPEGPLPASTVRSLATATVQGTNLLFAGTDAGLYRSRNAGRSWQACNQGLPGLDKKTGASELIVRSLAVGPDEGTLFAGTARGVYRTDDAGRRWKAANRGLPGTDPFSAVSNTDVRSVVAYRDRRRSLVIGLAATSAGLFRSSDGGESWLRAEKGLGGEGAGVEVPEVLTLLAVDDPVTRILRVYAGTRAGLWSTIDHGESWARIEIGGPLEIHALAAGPDGRGLIAATPFSGFAFDWPGYRLQGRAIDLDNVVPGVVPGSWAVLRPGTGAPGIYPVRRVSTVQRRDYSLAATVSRLDVEPSAPPLESFDLRDTRVFVQSDELAPRPRLVIEMSAALKVLRAAVLAIGDDLRKVIVAGKTPPLTFETMAPLAELTEPLQRLRRDLALVRRDEEAMALVWFGTSEDESPDVSVNGKVADVDAMLAALGSAPGSARSLESVLGVAARPAMMKAIEARIRVRVRILPRTAGCTLKAGELARQLDGLTERSAAETGADGTVQVVRFTPPGTPSGSAERLELDASTLQIYANVVGATEGLTVHDEILGNGDATEPNPTFTLAQPLAFFRGDGFPRPNLEVRVQGQLWRQVEMLHRETGESRVYRLRLDENGRATVIFGDGKAGARLPTGAGNVTATYSTGMTSRTVAAGGLSLLATRPLGLEAIINPVASTPGAPPESREEIRANAPRSVRLLDRIVSLREYEDFARGFPGIEKAGAWGLLAAGGLTVQITLALPDGHPLEAGDALPGELRDAIERIRCHPSPIVILGFRPVDVAIVAKVKVAPDFLWRDVEPRIRAALLLRFGFAAAAFEGGINGAAVVGTIQSVKGVRAVDLDSMTWTGDSDEDVRREAREARDAGERRDVRERRARPPYWDAAAQEVRAAELVILSAIELTEDPQP